MAVRPNYKKRYSREEYAELVEQERRAALLPEIIASAIQIDPLQPPWEVKEEFETNLREKVSADLGIDSTTTSTKTSVSPYWYYAGVGLLALLAAGPLYRMTATTMPKKGSRKRSKAYTFNEQTAASLDAASVNATRVMASLAPVMGIPISYIGVQMMEDHGMISKGLGNAVQGLITTAAAGQLVSGIAGLIP